MVYSIDDKKEVVLIRRLLHEGSVTGAFFCELG